ncbi:MAG: hypothetical protein HQK87_04775 [Nitrospinae bacterium]|nr:hypothetical protein [Nitrospinota bacterium]
MRPIRFYPLLLATIALPGAAFADVTLSYAVAGEPAPLVVQYHDAGTMRAQQAEKEFAVVNGGRLYYCERLDRRWRVVDVLRASSELDQTGLGDVVRQEVKRRSDTVAVTKVTLKDTGRPELVAGVAGTVYEAVVEKEDGSSERHELVMTADPRALTAWNGFMGVAAGHLERIGDVIDLGVAGIRSAKALATFREAGRAPIRIDDRMRLSAMSEEPITPERFELPARPVGLVGGGLSELEKLFGQ